MARPLLARADLLRAWAETAGSDVDALADSSAQRLAQSVYLYRQSQQSSEHAEKTGSGLEPGTAGGQTTSPPGPTENQPSEAAPALALHAWVILDSQILDAREDRISGSEKLGPLESKDFLPRDLGLPPDIVPLVRRTRLWPALSRALSLSRFGSLDVPYLVRSLASARPPRRLPRRRSRTFESRLIVVRDVAHRLVPYGADFDMMLREVRRLHGADAVHVWLVDGTPGTVLAGPRSAQSKSTIGRRLPRPAPGSRILVLGDLGVLCHDETTRQLWIDWCRQCGEQGATPVAWVPSSARRIPGDLTRVARVHCLGDRSLRAVFGASPANLRLPAAELESLLTAMACCVRVEPALLRCLRELAPDTAVEPGLEALVWDHPSAVWAGERFCELAPDLLAHYRARFSRLTPERQAAIARCIAFHHAYRGRSTESLEATIWRIHASNAAMDRDLADWTTRGETWLQRLTEHRDGRRDDLVEFAKGVLQRQASDRAWWAGHSPTLAILSAWSEVEELPAGLDERDVARAKGFADVRPRKFVLAQQVRPPALTLVDQQARQTKKPEGLRAELLAGCLSVVDVQGGVGWGGEGGARTRWIPADGDQVALPAPILPDGNVYVLSCAGVEYRLLSLPRPSWAQEWGWDPDGLYALAPSPLGTPVKLRWTPSPHRVSAERLGPRAFLAAPVRLAEGLRMGADLRDGLYLDLELSGANQRFRWIEPGEFRMGSPEDEPGRNSNEGPQHWVRLTEGYWLADTACTQSLWMAVMGMNPSHFNDDTECPVEQVSWNDVEVFVGKLNAKISGLGACLPTEAEWEYACRAGTETAFWFGDNVTPEQVNYDGNYPYADGEKSEYRERTLPVKALEPNGWGLYQMHGNVDEWCADGMRDYQAGEATDPEGPDGGARALRGGSWDFSARSARSAYRYAFPPGYAYHRLGFRLCLRSTGLVAPGRGAEAGGDRPPVQASEQKGLLGRIRDQLFGKPAPLRSRRTRK